MCDVCLKIMYPRNCWRSWFINQTYSLVQTGPPAIPLSTNKPTVAPPAFSLSDTSVLLWGHWMPTSTCGLGLWLVLSVWQKHRWLLLKLRGWSLMLLHTAEPDLRTDTLWNWLSGRCSRLLWGWWWGCFRALASLLAGDSVQHDVRTTFFIHTLCSAVVQIWAKFNQGYWMGQTAALCCSLDVAKFIFFKTNVCITLPCVN